jgi:hypothetical protein
MRLVPTAATIWFATDLLLNWIPAPTIAACSCALLGMTWITYAALRMAAEREASGSAAGH